MVLVATVALIEATVVVVGKVVVVVDLTDAIDTKVELVAVGGGGRAGIGGLDGDSASFLGLSSVNLSAFSSSLFFWLKKTLFNFCTEPLALVFSAEPDTELSRRLEIFDALAELLEVVALRDKAFIRAATSPSPCALG